MGKKSRVVYQREDNVMNYETGEIIERSGTIIRSVQKEPNFIKVYLDTMMAFNGVKGIPASVLISFSNYITYANTNMQQMEISFTQRNKKQISEELGISVDMVRKYITKCVENGVFFKSEFRGTYIVNPWLIARGEWKNITQLRAEFDFMDGKWKYNKS